MSTRIDSRSYTNVILTVIAVLLLAMVVHAYRLSVTSTAGAQVYSTPTPRIPPSGFGPVGRNAPVDAQNAPITQDIAVAAATESVAASNREIAQALLQVARAIESAGAGLGKLAAPAAVTAGAVGSPSPSAISSAPAGSASAAPLPEALNVTVRESR